MAALRYSVGASKVTITLTAVPKALVALLVVVIVVTTLHIPHAELVNTSSGIDGHFMVWSTQVPYLGSSGPHDLEYFRVIKELGFNTIILTVPWGAVEYAPNEYDFHILDQYMNYTRELGLNVILAFFYSVSPAAGDPDPIPTWLLNGGELEVNPYGQSQNPPALAWWNETDRQYYFNFIKTVITRYVNYSNFLGVLVNFGWLDDDWGPGVNGLPPGYARSDILAFQRWLENRYRGNITLLNEEWGTDYSGFSQITPSTMPFVGNWQYFQEFRVWSINETYSQLFSMVRGIIGPDKMLLFYWGGAIDDIYGIQLPEVYFQLARRYNVTIILDDADSTTNAVFFGQLAKVYHVHIMMEWTPVHGLTSRSYYGMYVSHIALGYPWLVGEDYYVFIPSLGVLATAQVNQMAIEIYGMVNGTIPKSNVALLYVTLPGYTYGQFTTLQSETSMIPGSMMPIGNGEYAYYPFSIITADEVEMGLVNLSQFKYIIPMAPIKYYLPLVAAELSKWVKGGGVLLNHTADVAKVEKPLIISNESIEAYPLVNGKWAFIVANNWGSGILTPIIHMCIDKEALGLLNTTYYMIELNSGDVLNATSGDWVCANVDTHGTQSAFFLALIPVRQEDVSIRVYGVNATYDYESGVLNITLSGVVEPRGDYFVVALAHINESEYGIELTDNGMIYESVGAGTMYSKNGYFKVSLSLPIYQLELNNYYIPIHIYAVQNGYIVGNTSLMANASFIFKTTPQGWIPTLVSIGILGAAKSPPPSMVNTTTTVTSTTTLTSTITATMAVTTTIVSTTTITSTTTIVKYTAPTLLMAIVLVLLAVVIVIIAVVVLVKGRVD